ncbi:hypothetical protein ACGFNX_07465 [Streptomyces sp. NPDC048723]|uniref:hypothetical protein n=1 Tax=unclassified Streptomyces TaxID=2593676 RepID=UPI000AC5C639
MTTALTDVRPAAGWDFGAYPYALETLVLPDPAARLRGGGPGPDAPDFADGSAVVPAGSPEELFWFRWITGHQAVFALWQLLDDELELVLADTVEGAAVRATALMDAYSALLVYTGSPSRQLYNSLIRPAMMLQHRMFSGRWASDYVSIPPKLRALRARFRRGTPTPTAIAALNRAGKVNHRVHMAIAAKLVPDGDSLLRAGDAVAYGAPTEETARLYDSFFATHRALTPRSEVIAQLLRRLHVIMLDLRSNGLYPEAWCPAAECPEELADGELAVFSDRIELLLAEAGRTAATLCR